MGFDELVQHDLSEMTTGIGNGLTGGNGSPVGIADGGVGNAEIDNSAAFQFNGDLTLGQATTNYVLQQGPFSGSLEVRAQSDNNVRFSLRDAKNDGSNTITYSISPNGNAGTTDFQVGEFVHNAGGNRYSIRTRSGGTKTARPIHLRPNQTTAFVARTDGNVAMNNRLLVGSTGAATNALGVSGGAVVGSGYAGSNTAPTNGALFEGGVGFGTTSVSGAATFGENAYVGSGNEFIVGDTSSQEALLRGTRLAAYSTDASGLFEVIRYRNDKFATDLTVGKSRSGTINSTGTALQSGDVVGRVRWAGDDGTDLSNEVARVQADVDGSVSTDAVPGRLQFQTTTTGGTLTEALRIDSSQNVSMTSELVVGTSTGTSPDRTLDIRGNSIIQSTTPGIQFRETGNNNDFGLLHDPSATQLIINYNGGVRTLIDKDTGLRQADGIIANTTSSAPANALDVSGAAAIGSSFAGSNTAPTDGLLVEGKMAIGNSSVTTGGLHVETAGGDDLGRFQIQDGGSIYPRSGLFLSNVSGVSGGEMYSLIFDRGSGTRFASITARYEDATGGSENGRLEIRTRNNGSEREALRLDFQQRTILRQSNNSPGTPSNPIFQIGGGGAGLFVDSNGDVVAVDNSGNTNVLT